MQRTLAVTAVLLLLAAVPLVAQQHPNNARGFDPDKAYQASDIDSVNLFNGNLVVSIPIGQRFSVSDHLQYGLALVYNGNPWDYREDGGGPEAMPGRFQNAGIGWQMTMGDLVAPNDTLARKLNKNGSWVYAAPDGSEHVFYRTLHAEEVGKTAFEAAATPADDDVVGYARDSSYLRLVRIGLTGRFERDGGIGGAIYWYWTARYKLEFPDGTVHTFKSEEYLTADSAPPVAFEQSLQYSLETIEDRFGNTVSITDASLPNGAGMTRTIDDHHGRIHTITFAEQDFFQFHTESPKRFLVSSVKLAAPGNATVEYVFTYGGYDTISKPCPDVHDVQTTSGRFLTSITARDPANPSATLLRYSMTNHKLETTAAGTTCSPWAGHLTSLTLPSGGRIEYEAGERSLPALVDGTPKEGGGAPVTTAIAVGKRTMVNTDASRAPWTYQSFLRHGAVYPTADGFKTIHRELVVLVTDPLQRSTANYFNAFITASGDDTCFPGASSLEFALPFTRSAGSGTADLYLSSEIYPTACTSFTIGTSNGCDTSVCQNGGATVTPVRRSYVAYEFDTLSTGVPDNLHNARLRASRTRFADDTGCGASGCYVETRLTEFDGLGHYRSEAQSSNFPGGTTRAVRTNYNANQSSGTYACNSGSVPEAYMVGKSDEWLLNLYDSVRTSQTYKPDLLESVCFDRANGFLTRRRTVASTTNGRTDFVTAFGHTEGNVTSEMQYGGDVAPLPVSNGCDEALGTAAYQILHTYASGVRVASQYLSASFKSLDLTVDSAGFPVTSKDPAGLPTTFTYDVLGRVTRMAPIGEAWMQYTYDLDSVDFFNDPASVKVQVWPYGSAATGTPIAEKRYYYDGFGRLIQSRSQMPGGWSTVQFTFDLLGRRTAQSTPQYQGAGDFQPIATPHTSTYAYDRFDRLTSVTQPDGKLRTTSYTGARVVTDTVDVGMTASYNTATNLPRITESPVSRTQYFDGHGRLQSVEEHGPAASLIATSYDYDGGNRLTRVEMLADGVTQIRTFSYDGRGMLLSERVPEKGAGGDGFVYYGTVDGSGNVTPSYDSGGMPTRRIEGMPGGKFDLAFSYDGAKRLTAIKDLDPNGLRRTLQSVTYATDNAPSGCTAPPCDARNGKPLTATRYNVVPDLGTIAVTETYTYSDVGGRASRRQTSVSGTGSFAGASFDLTQDWDEQGQLVSVTYPTSASFSGAPSRTVGSTYTHGLLTAVNGYAAVTYQANGLIDRIVHGSGPTAVTESWIPDLSGMARPMRISIEGPNSFFRSYGDYAYDAAGNIVRIGDTSYTYDSLQRLSDWTEWADTDVYGKTTRGLDSFGNHLYTVQKGCAWNGRCFDTGLVPLAIDSETNHYAHETYDAAGNVLSDGTHTFAYDNAGRMVSLVGNGRNERYLYTADDERIAIVKRVTTSGGTRNKTEWTLRNTANQLLRTFTDNSETGTRVWSWTEDEIWRGANVLASETPSGRKQYHLDHLGSPGWVTNTSGTLLGEQHFQPFGDGGTTDGGRLQFTAHERDGREASDPIDYAHARYMVSGRGRFLSVDPVLDLKKTMAHPQTWNRYAYVLNNPMRFTDPTGKYTCSGTKDECKNFEAALTVVRAGATEASRNRQPGAAALNEVVAHYGKADDKNGVNVTFGKTRTGGVMEVGRAGEITVDRKQFATLVSAGNYFGMAKLEAHEGNHSLMKTADPSLVTTTSRSDSMMMERNGYRMHAYMHSAFGFDDTAGQTWSTSTGYDQSWLNYWAGTSVALTCSVIKCTP